MASHASAATLCDMSGDSSLRAVASGAVGGTVHTSPSEGWLSTEDHVCLFKAMESSVGRLEHFNGNGSSLKSSRKASGEV